MATELEYANTYLAVKKARHAVLVAGIRFDEPALLVANRQLADAKRAYNEKYEELKVLFAILREHSPE